MDASAYLYRHFDAAGRLLYVGIANHPKRRLVAHGSAKAPWHSSVSSSTYERFPNRAKAAEAEQLAIKEESPLWNVSNTLAKLTRALHPVKIPKSRSQPATLLVPSECCFARDGLLISFRTRGPAHHREVKIPNGEEVYRYDYRAVVDWMEWFGHDFIEGVIIGRDSLRMYWVDALDRVAADWREECVHRPSIGLIQEPWPYRL